MKLDMNGMHRVHTLFSGTSIVTIDTEDTKSMLANVPVAPDGGVVAYVLRTGFSSSQGTHTHMRK
jgi:cation-transporting ATPase 13A1